MKTTLNLGSLSFNSCSPMPENKTQVTLDIKDITVTFEASVEETLADIQMTLDCVKELKNLGSEIANLFSDLQNKKEIRREKEMEEEKSSFDERFKTMSDRIDADIKEMTKKFDSFSAIVGESLISSKN